MLRNELIAWINQVLEVDNFQDYAPNGLQVEGREMVQKIVCAVTASRAAIDYAIGQKADMLLVHHGMFWKNEMPCIVGWKKERISRLLAHQINLLAYHLPLDAHPKWGNNAMLAERLAWKLEGTAEQGLLNIGRTEKKQSLFEFANHIEQVLQRKPLVIGDWDKTIENIAWCSGGAQGFFPAVCMDSKIDAYITGEASEAQYHYAHETGTAFIAAGHHATEKFGVQALSRAICDEFGVQSVFFDEENPI